MLPLKKKGFLCSGCTACVNVCPHKAIHMKGDMEGFLYPEIQQGLCRKCGLCIKVCPQFNVSVERKLLEQPMVKAAWHRDNVVRRNSSSGGIFTLLAENVLQEEGVVVGAGFGEDLKVMHMPAYEKRELAKLRGSKYIQSILGEIYKLVKLELQKGRHVMFTGTPCQVAGLYGFLGKDEDRLLTCDLVCHGVPSPLFFRKYIRYQSRRNQAMATAIHFRDKTSGWKNYRVSIEYDNGRIETTATSEDLFMKAFLKDLCLRPSCYECNFKGLPRAGDITLGDFWGINLIHPEADDDGGTSLLLLNTEKGRDAFSQIGKKVVQMEASIQDAARYNPCLLKPAERPISRDAFWRDFRFMPFGKLALKYLKSESGYISISKKIKRKLNKISNGFLRSAE